jgi:regulatory protein
MSALRSTKKAEFTAATLRERAMRLLARREYASGELSRRLQAQGAPSALAREVVAQLVQEGWVSDERFTGAFVRSRRSRGDGPLKLRAELRERGVAADIIADQIDPQAEADWLPQLQALCVRHFPQPAADYAQWAKQARFLIRKGYTHAQIRRVWPPPRESE